MEANDWAITEQLWCDLNILMILQSIYILCYCFFILFIYLKKTSFYIVSLHVLDAAEVVRSLTMNMLIFWYSISVSFGVDQFIHIINAMLLFYPLSYNQNWCKLLMLCFFFCPLLSHIKIVMLNHCSYNEDIIRSNVGPFWNHVSNCVHVCKKLKARFLYLPTTNQWNFNDLYKVVKSCTLSFRSYWRQTLSLASYWSPRWQVCWCWWFCLSCFV